MARKNAAAVELGRRGGRARVKNQTVQQRKDSARKAAEARWAKAKRDIQDDVKRAKKIAKELSQLG